MNLLIPFLMFFIPGVIAVSVHERRLIHFTRDNWQPLIWKYLLYSFAIFFVVNSVMFFNSPGRSVSYSPWTTWTTNNVLQVGFVFKYTLFAVAAAFGLPKLWVRRHSIIENILNVIQKRKTFRIADDE